MRGPGPERPAAAADDDDDDEDAASPALYSLQNTNTHSDPEKSSCMQHSSADQAKE